MTTAFVGIGSNLSPQTNIVSAIKHLLCKYPQISLSPIFESPAIGFQGKPFLNLVAQIDNVPKLEKLEKDLAHIEHVLSRFAHRQRYANRCIDLDLLTFGNTVIHNDDLDLPRSDILRFPFVLKPLSMLAPDAKHPLLQLSYAMLWENFNQEYVQLIDKTEEFSKTLGELMPQTIDQY